MNDGITVHRNQGIAAAALAFSAVAFGAFGAHVLRDRLDASSLQLWHTAVEYQFWHALALFALAGFAPRGKTWTTASLAFGLGCVLFSGSLYALALGAPRATGAITPFGGLSFLVGWIAAGLGFWRSASEKNPR